MKNKQKAKFSFGAYLSFFTRFPIPWWLFLLSLLLGFANTEVVLAVSNYLIRINKGELYNGVIIGYALMNVFNALLSMLINLTGGYGSALVTLRARKLLWRKILHLPMREVERRQPSALISGPGQRHHPGQPGGPDGLQHHCVPVQLFSLLLGDVPL